MVNAVAMLIAAATTARLSGALTVNRTTVWAVLADPSSPAIKSSIKDLKRDWYMAMDSPPNVLDGAMPEIWNGQSVLVFDVDLSGALPKETFTVAANASMSAGNYTTITITGADPLGLAYGIYYLSEQWFGVDPWWWFIDAPSKRVPSINVPDDFRYVKAERKFQRAGFFLNDEEMSAQARSDGSGDSVFDPNYVDRVCETLLRLGGNQIIVESFGLVDESSFLTVENRGVTLAQHHVTPMGLNVYAWPLGVPYCYRLNHRLYHFAWKALAEYQVILRPNREVAFSVGLRGLWDSPFWGYDPYVKTDQQKGALITWAAGNQTNFLHEASQAANRSDPKIVSYTWMELLRLKQEGYLRLPEGVAAIWADTGYGFIRGWQNASSGDGLYTHAMMLNGNANQISEMVPPRRAFQQLSQMQSRNATSYAIINTSDNSPAMLSIEAYMRYLWDAGVSTKTGASANENEASGSSSWQSMQDEYISEWVNRYYPADQSIAQDVAQLYGLYYNISWMASENPDDAHTGDDGITRSIGSCLGAYSAWFDDPKAKVDPSSGRSPLQHYLPSMPLLEHLQQQMVPSIEKRLFSYTFENLAGEEPDTRAWNVWKRHTSLQPAVQYGLASTAAIVANASIIANQTGNRALVQSMMYEGLENLDDLLSSMRDAGGRSGPLRGYYQYDQFTFVSSWRQAIYHGIMHMDGTHADEPAKNKIGNADVNIYGYECSHNSPYGCSAFPFHHYNSSVAWDAVVRAFCSDDAPPGPGETGLLGKTAGSLGQEQAEAMAVSFEDVADSLEDGSCKTTWTGGVYKADSTTVKLFVARPGASIFYTSTGQDPVPGQQGTSPYEPDSGITVTGQTTLVYQAFSQNEVGKWNALAVPVVTYWDNGKQ